jgi:hypothetical protein
MNIASGFSILLGMLALLCAGAGILLQWIWRRRFLSLQQEMGRFSEDLLQVVELQSDLYRRVSRGLSEVEEKVLELSVPSSETPLPLERRHQVLTLARKGVSVDEIASRLNMPKGEAELIMNLRKYASAKTPETPPSILNKYARAGSGAR